MPNKILFVGQNLHLSVKYVSRLSDFTIGKLAFPIHLKSLVFQNLKFTKHNLNTTCNSSLVRIWESSSQKIGKLNEITLPYQMDPEGHFSFLVELWQLWWILQISEHNDPPLFSTIGDEFYIFTSAYIATIVICKRLSFWFNVIYDGKLFTCKMPIFLTMWNITSHRCRNGSDYSLTM